MKLINFESFDSDTGTLSVYERFAPEDFELKRVFIVAATSGVQRGAHAHFECQQILVAVSGSVVVDCRRNGMKERHVLDRPDVGLLLPKMTWAEQTYMTDDTILMVMCDRLYAVEDYIRNFEEFLSYEKKFFA